MEARLFNRQFLLSKTRCESLRWACHNIGGYFLYAHPNLELTVAHNHDVEAILLGYLFDHQVPERSNQDILNGLVSMQKPDALLERVDQCSGQYVLIFRSDKHCIVLHDAGGQQEIFYDTAFTTFASQPKLLQLVVQAAPIADSRARQFYTSDVFNQSKVFVGSSTHLEDVWHLSPNHYLDLDQKKVVRCFPRQHRTSLTGEVAADRAIGMLRGFLRAASLRYDLRIGLTAGYDSRVLFLASLGIECQYYTSKNSSKDNAVDIAIAKRLARAHHQTLHVDEHMRRGISDEAMNIQDISIDFPRYRPLREYHPKKMIVNGNISEIARSYYGDHAYESGAELARVSGFGNSVHAHQIFEGWLSNHRTSFEQLGYDYRDMFYWEEKIGNWAAKGKTEAALNAIVYSPFCCRRLLEVLLSTDRSQRDKYENNLYHTMIARMSPGAVHIPINPNYKTRVIKAMKRMGIYSLYRRMGMKYNLLKS